MRPPAIARESGVPVRTVYNIKYKTSWKWL